MTIRELIETAQREEYITVTELAVLLRRNPQALYRSCRRGLIPGVVRHGRLGRIKRPVALRFCQTQVD